MMKRISKGEIKLNNGLERIPVPIISDASISARGVADGRLIPHIIVDTANRPDIENMILTHIYQHSGDVNTYWYKTSKWKWKWQKVGLLLEITNPNRCIIRLEFDLTTYMSSVVDQIVYAEGLYLQAGRQGDQLAHTIDTPRILIEVHTQSIKSDWEKLFCKSITACLRKTGKSKQEAKRLTPLMIQEIRERRKLEIQ